MSISLTNLWNSVGKRADSAVETVGTASSLMSYVKGNIQLIAQLENPKTAYISSTARVSVTDVVNIADKGVLTGIHVAVDAISGQAGYIVIQITIDGVALTALSNFPHDDADSRQASLSFFHRFDTSLRIQFTRTGSGTSEVTKVSVSYTTD